MTTAIAPVAGAEGAAAASLRERLQNVVPKLVLAPSFIVVLIFVYGFNLWTLLLSFTSSKAF